MTANGHDITGSGRRDRCVLPERRERHVPGEPVMVGPEASGHTRDPEQPALMAPIRRYRSF